MLQVLNLLIAGPEWHLDLWAHWTSFDGDSVLLVSLS